jgi:hypothetical protein
VAKKSATKKKIKKSRPAPAPSKKPAVQPKRTEALQVRQVLEATAGILANFGGCQEQFR